MTRFSLIGGRVGRVAPAVALLSVILISPLRACPACLGTGPLRLTLVQQIIDTDVTVLAEQTQAPRAFRVMSVIKANSPGGGDIILPVSELPANGLPPGKLAILGRHLFTRQWVLLGSISPGNDAWLKTLAVMKRTKDLNHAERAERVQYFFGALDHAEPIIAQTAYEEIRRSPYRAMLTLRPRLDPERILDALPSITDAERYSFYLLLLGIAGGDAARAKVSSLIAESHARRSSALLPALLTAKLELEGEQALASVCAGAGPSPSSSEVTASERPAALMALSVPGGASGTIPRSAIVLCYAELLKRAPDTAGRIAADLLAWSEWGLAAQPATALSSGVPDAAGEFAIVSYLRANPTPPARSAIAAFDAARKAGPRH